MANSYSRRTLLKTAAVVLPAQLACASMLSGEAAQQSSATPPLPDTFPTQPPELVREVVLVAHFDLKRLKALVDERPSLARAAWDWGFGDWESALGAASHIGNRPIADYLISKGARPSLFSATMMGELDVVKAFVAAQPGIQKIRGPHSISLLSHAKAGGAQARPVFEFLQQLGDADGEPSAPLSEPEIARVIGTYIYGDGPTQQVEITADKGALTWTRKGMIGRPLHHLGDLVFHPAGADLVRIRFSEADGAVTMTIHDPGPVLVCRKSGAPRT